MNVIEPTYRDISLGEDRYIIASSLYEKSFDHKIFYLLLPISILNWVREDKSLNNNLKIKISYYRNHSTLNSKDVISPINFNECNDDEWILWSDEYEPKHSFTSIEFPEFIKSDQLKIIYQIPPKPINNFSNVVYLVLAVICAIISYKLTLIDGQKRLQKLETQSNPKIFEYEMQRKYGRI